MGSYLEKPYDLDCWADAPARLSASPLRIGSTVGHWWPRTSGARDVRDLTLRSQTDPIESGRLSTLVKDQELVRSEEHTSELQSLMRISYAVFCLKKKKN